MSGFIIAPMQAWELDAVALLERQIFSDAWSKEAFAEELNSPFSELFTARREEELAGYLALRCVLDEGEITNVAVNPAFRRLGCGKLLLEQAFTVAKRRELSTLMLEVRKSNAPAIALYQSFGFVKVGERRNYYHDPLEDALLMTCLLQTQ